VEQPSPPVIFAPARRLAVRRRMLRAQLAGHAPRYLLDDMIADVTERLAFLRHTPHRVLAIGDLGELGAKLASPDCGVTGLDPAARFDQEAPFSVDGYDTVISLGTLDTANDLPGALIHLRNALTPGGLVLASMVGAGSLPHLRDAMLTADGDRPAPRLHPAVDVRGGGQLLQRVGWGNPVVDSRSLSVRFSGLASLVADLRAQGLSNCLARSGPPLTRAQLAIASDTFGSGTVETFEILTFTGWKT
jgi:hypothetical protein